MKVILSDRQVEYLLLLLEDVQLCDRINNDSKIVMVDEIIKRLSANKPKTKAEDFKF